MKTKWIAIPCLIPEHQRRSKYKTCQRICNLGQILICARCESEIEVDEKIGQYCPKCVEW